MKIKPCSLIPLLIIRKFNNETEDVHWQGSEGGWQTWNLLLTVYQSEWNGSAT